MTKPARSARLPAHSEFVSKVTKGLPSIGQLFCWGKLLVGANSEWAKKVQVPPLRHCFPPHRAKARAGDPGFAMTPVGMTIHLIRDSSNSSLLRDDFGWDGKICKWVRQSWIRSKFEESRVLSLNF
ncbi:MAG: hypothetical protein WBD10_06230 [Acidobacteriaceae bacterium]